MAWVSLAIVGAMTTVPSDPLKSERTCPCVPGASGSQGWSWTPSCWHSDQRMCSPHVLPWRLGSKASLVGGTLVPPP